MMNTKVSITLKRPQKNIAVRFGVGCLALMAAPFLVGMVITFMIGNIGPAIFFMVMVGFFIGPGYIWLKWMRRKEEERELLFQDKSVLQVAALQEGVVTVAQLTHMTLMSVPEINVTMDRLCRQGLAYVDLLDDGTVIYRFHGLGPLRLDEPGTIPGSIPGEL